MLQEHLPEMAWRIRALAVGQGVILNLFVAICLMYIHQKIPCR